MTVQGKTFLDYLDDIVEACHSNVEQYEEFHEGRLADIRNLPSMDAFLYGLASGKLDMAVSFRELITELMIKYEYEHEE